MSFRIEDRAAATRALQGYLYELSRRFPWMPVVYPDGAYGERTREAVRVFQEHFGLPMTGVTDRLTWERVYRVYRETMDYRTRHADPSVGYADLPLAIGSRGYAVQLLHAALAQLADHYETLPAPAPSSFFQYSSASCVAALQKIYRQKQTGKVDAALWNRIFADLASKQACDAERKDGAGYPDVYDPTDG